jgi:hypothetical protein
MSEYNISILVDAKQEYTKQLITILKPEILSSFISIYNEALDLCRSNKENDLILLRFQDLLSQVPKWNQNMIDEICKDIITTSGCDWLDDLITAIFVSHTKILTTVRVGNKSKKINLKIPCLENFIHRTYINVARELWKTPDLLHEKKIGTKLEYQKNIKTVELIISECIETTIRSLLPVKNILKEYLYEHENEKNLDREEDDLYMEEQQGGQNKEDTDSTPLSKVEPETKNIMTTNEANMKKDNNPVIDDTPIISDNSVESFQNDIVLPTPEEVVVPPEIIDNTQTSSQEEPFQWSINTDNVPEALSATELSLATLQTQAVSNDLNEIKLDNLGDLLEVVEVDHVPKY